jgi:hypothetical protein
MPERDEGGESPCLAPLFEEQLFGETDQVVDKASRKPPPEPEPAR